MSWYSIPFVLSKAKNRKILANLQVSPYGLVLPMAAGGLAMAPAATANLANRSAGVKIAGNLTAAITNVPTLAVHLERL